MPAFSADREVDHAASTMLDLVADVEDYPQFVPLCEAVKIRGSGEERGATVLIADMTVSYKVFRETFTTRAVVDREALTVDISYLDGPFHHLDCTWKFAERGEHRCAVHFHIDYAFRSRMLATAMGAVFERAFKRFSDAFVERADAVYGAGIATTA